MSECRKWKFDSRADAKKARRKLYGNRGGADGPLSIYSCEPCGAYHLGHLPQSVRNGTVTKDAYLKRGARVRD